MKDKCERVFCDDIKKEKTIGYTPIAMWKNKCLVYLLHHLSLTEA